VYSGIQGFALDAGDSGDSSLQVLGALFFRNAFMLDHQEVARDTWRYSPPELAVRYLESAGSTLGGVPVRAMLHLVEALALNEDVKYNPPGSAFGPTGRQNNMLTCAHMTALFMNAVTMGGFVDGIVRGRGVAPLTQQTCIDTFRLLRWPQSTHVASMEQRILRTCAPLVGKTVDDLARHAGIEQPGTARKDRVAHVLKVTLAATLEGEAFDALFDGFNVKTIRVKDSGVPAEDISFPAIREDIAVAQSWATSDLRRLWGRPFLFAVFSAEPVRRERLLGMAFCSIPLDDLEERARESWTVAIEGLLRGDRASLPKKSETDYFVRDHSAKRRLGPDGQTITPLSFWLSREYVKALIEGKDAQGIGAYRR
jgi:DNA mismatch repair protein MutH